MAPNRPGFITDREAEVLRILWESGEARLQEILKRHDELNEHEASYSAILKALQRLERKQMVSRIRIGNSNIYAPTISVAYARQLMMWHVVQNYFDGDIMQLRRWVEQELDLVKRAKAQRDARIAERLRGHEVSPR